MNVTSTASDTWTIEQHDHSLSPDTPCRIAVMDNYGEPTEFLYCHTHGTVAGTITYAGSLDD